MFKQAAIFVVSTGFLVYFLAPLPEDQKSQPKTETTEAAPAKKEADDDDGWGDDDEDDDDEVEFVFGEPMTGSDSNEDEEYEEEEGGSENGGDGWGDNSSSGSDRSEKAKAVRARSVHPDSPKDGELGSASNPKVLKTNNPADPEDD